MRPSLLRLAALAGVAAAGMAAACFRGEQYVYTARKYDPAGMCLAAYSAVETVPGTESSTCDPLCFTVGTEIYVSTMCPPLPAIATELQADAGDCVAALKALERSCDEPADAGPDEAGEAASVDAGPDASGDAADAAAPQDAGDAG